MPTGAIDQHSRTRRRVLAIATPIVLIALVATWLSTARAGDEAAEAYLDARTPIASLQTNIARLALVDDAAAASTLASLDLQDPEGPGLGDTTLPMCEPVPELTPAPDVQQLASVPLGWTSGAYVDAQATATSDAAALEAYDELMAAAHQHDVVGTLTCSAVAGLDEARRHARVVIDDELSLGTLRAVAPEGVELTSTLQEGTSLLTPVCDGIVGCGQIPLDESAASLTAGNWLQWAIVSGEFADAYRACPVETLVTVCDAHAAMYDQRTLDERAIAEAYLAASHEQIETAFASRDEHWATSQAAVEAALEDAGSSSFEEALHSTWLEEATSYASLADAATTPGD